jgi:hypothetical protein
MTTPDPLWLRLAELPALEPPAELTSRLRAQAHARLRARPVHPIWVVAVVVCVVSYLGWALRFAGSLL